MKENPPNLTNSVQTANSWRAPCKVACIYALVAGLWILLSDRLLLLFIANAEALTWLQTVKGWLFVFATALMLAWLVRRYMAALQTEVNSCYRAQESFRALVENIPHGIQECDTTGKITFTNASYDRIFGYRQGEAIGTTVWDNVVGEDADLMLKNYLAELVAQQPDATPFVTRNRTKDGRTIDVQVDWGYLRDDTGELAGFASVVTDITERRMAEEAIFTSDRLKSELIGTAAHEFRTPLATIQGYSELLLSDHQFSDEEKREYVGSIYRKSLNMADMVDNLLDMSRIEAGQPLPMKIAPCTVAELAREVAPFLKTLGDQSQMEVDLSDEETLVLADVGKIGQVLENLLSNAAKYSERGSLICLRGERHERGYRLEVIDQGIGMSEEQVGRVFERFYRANISDTGPSGLGIGMAIVKVIVEAHGSEIRIESSSGAGTRVSFDLPFPQ